MRTFAAAALCRSTIREFGIWAIPRSQGPLCGDKGVHHRACSSPWYAQTDSVLACAALETELWHRCGRGFGLTGALVDKPASSDKKRLGALFRTVRPALRRRNIQAERTHLPPGS